MRLFLATSFPEPVIRDLNARITQFKSRLPAASWVRPEAQHLTFAFLGEQPEALVERIAAPLQAALAAVPRFTATVRGSGLFPNPRHARVGWAGLEPDKNFQGVAQVVRAVVKANGVQLDSADFKPHLTLFRIREGWPPASIDLFQRSLSTYRSEPFTVDTITLYESKLDPRGAVHTALRRFALA
ncbi:MAG TPA: RNA 2',3'-cyclic phosphodiesterase [Thermoanaerobaculia bacterium]|jgi:2'-5' RNA ligase